MSATGTPTPNLGLRIPLGTDPASVDDINYNSNALDTIIGDVGETPVAGQLGAANNRISAVQAGLAIVCNGNTHAAIESGQFAYVKNHGTLAEGLYRNNTGSTIAANATLSSSNLTADSSGGLNTVYDALNSKIATQDIGTFSSLASLESALVELNSNIDVSQFKNVTFVVSTAFGEFTNTTYKGTVLKLSDTRIHCEFYKSSGSVDSPVIGKYNNSWTWDKLGLNSNITSMFVSKSANFTNGVATVEFSRDFSHCIGMFETQNTGNLVVRGIERTASKTAKVATNDSSFNGATQMNFILF